MDVEESQLPKLLTHVEASVREKTVSKICKYLSQREAVIKRIPDLDFQKLWKALYYCFWMTDKVFLQQEMATTLSSLSSSFKSFENINAFYCNFFVILRREWTQIDYHRLDKFLSLIRKNDQSVVKYFKRTQVRKVAC